MTLNHDAPDRATRIAVINDPQDVVACADCVRCVAASGAIFRWFRRLMILPVMVEADILWKALRAAGTIDWKVLQDWVNTTKITDKRIVPFVGAALIVHRWVDLDRLSGEPVWFSKQDSTYEKLISLLSDKTVPQSINEAFQIVLGKQWIESVLARTCNFVESKKLRTNISSHILNYRYNFNKSHERSLSAHWTFSIGHMVVLVYIVKSIEFEDTLFRKVCLWREPPVNRFLFDKLSEISKSIESTDRWSTFFDNHSSANLEYVDGRFVDYFEMCGVVADKSGRLDGSIFDKVPDTDPEVSAFFRAGGLDPSRPLVTLHCREPGFRDVEVSTLRDTDIETYLPALQALVDRGYQVVRLGDPTMSALPSIEGVFDYAHSPLKTQELDVLLPGTAAFHIGSSSGLSLVPLLFGTPCLFLNWYPFDMLPWGRRNWTVLKSITALEDGRRVVDRQAYSKLGKIRERRMLNVLGHDVHNLQPAEVSAAVEGFLETLDDPVPAEVRSTRNLGRVLVFDDDAELRPLA